MLEARQANSIATLELSSIKLPWASGFVNFSFNFKHTIMVDYNVSLNNQWPQEWFKTQALWIGERKSKLFWKMCKRKGGGMHTLS